MKAKVKKKTTTKNNAPRPNPASGNKKPPVQKVAKVIKTPSPEELGPIVQSNEEAIDDTGPQAQQAEASPPQIAQSASPKPVTKGKLLIILNLVSRPEGATLADLMKETGWLSHSVRAAITDALRKKRGYPIVTQKAKGETTVYKMQVVAE